MRIASHRSLVDEIKSTASAMRIEGQFLFEGIPSETLWNFLTDPERIAQCLPGCQKLVRAGDDTYEMALKITIGMIGGTFTGTIHLRNLNPVSEYEMSVSGKGAPGFIQGNGKVELSNTDSRTQLKYSGDVNAGGAIACVGQRMIGGAARMVIDQFFKCAAAKLAIPQP